MTGKAEFRAASRRLSSERTSWVAWARLFLLVCRIPAANPAWGITFAGRIVLCLLSWKRGGVVCTCRIDSSLDSERFSTRRRFDAYHRRLQYEGRAFHDSALGYLAVHPSVEFPAWSDASHGRPLSNEATRN